MDTVTVLALRKAFALPFYVGLAVTYALFLLGSQRLIRRVGPVRFTAYSMIVASLTALAVATVKGHPTGRETECRSLRMASSSLNWISSQGRPCRHRCFVN
ncbi:hypothetical protein [Thermithiobacillus plumbiphilus]|uniref:Uncharacterized protein n=1 Tax=Thermithiobacillus plumbiphilus TaxID=1729899 RepID=A0ABU9DC17_9PROT